MTEVVGTQEPISPRHSIRAPNRPVIQVFQCLGRAALDSSCRFNKPLRIANVDTFPLDRSACDLFGFRNEIKVVNKVRQDGHQCEFGRFLMSSDVRAAKRYSPPVLHRRTVDQAKLFLVGHAWIGHRGAKELLESLMRFENVALPRRRAVG